MQQSSGGAGTPFLDLLVVGSVGVGIVPGFLVGRHSIYREP
jgi:hypothetical protein